MLYGHGSGVPCCGLGSGKVAIWMFCVVYGSAVRSGVDRTVRRLGQPGREERPFGLVVCQIERGAVGEGGLVVAA